MKVEVDSDVEAVLKFMEERFSCDRLPDIAEGVAEMARILWGDSKARQPIPHIQGLADPV
jgi:hypothetical protein